MSFAWELEKVVHFARTAPTRSVSASGIEFVLHDSGDLNLKSLSSQILIPDVWTIKECPINSTQRSENVTLDGGTVILQSKLRLVLLVKNLSYHKKVMLRYSYNSWKTYADAGATFDGTVTVNSACGNYLGIDKFVCILDLQSDTSERTCFHDDVKLSFAISYCAAEVEYWDNNCGENYNVSVS